MTVALACRIHIHHPISTIHAHFNVPLTPETDPFSYSYIHLQPPLFPTTGLRNPFLTPAWPIFGSVSPCQQPRHLFVLVSAKLSTADGNFPTSYHYCSTILSHFSALSGFHSLPDILPHDGICAGITLRYPVFFGLLIHRKGWTTTAPEISRLPALCARAAVSCNDQPVKQKPAVSPLTTLPPPPLT